MSLFFRPAESRSMDASWFGIGSTPDGSRYVSEESATHLVPVFAALRHIVDYVSTLPTDFYRRLDNGKREQFSEPPLVRNVDDETGWGNWLGQMAYGMATKGNAVGTATAINAYGLPGQVEWSGSWSGGDDGPLFVDGKVPTPASLVHVPWIVPPGKRMGLSPIELAAPILRAGLSAQEYADLKRGGGIPPTHLKNTAKTLDKEASARVSDQAALRFASGKPFVSGNDWDLTIMTIPPNHAQFIETLKLSATQIAAIYGLDPREIGGSAADSLTYTNDESRALNRAHNMRPYLVRIEKAVSRMLPDRQFMKFNIDATIRTDMKTRTEVLGAEIGDGRRSVNEARALLDLGPVKGGDFYNVPAPTAEPINRDGATS